MVFPISTVHRVQEREEAWKAGGDSDQAAAEAPPAISPVWRRGRPAPVCTRLWWRRCWRPSRCEAAWKVDAPPALPKAVEV